MPKTSFQTTQNIISHIDVKPYFTRVDTVGTINFFFRSLRFLISTKLFKSSGKEGRKDVLEEYQ